MSEQEVPRCPWCRAAMVRRVRGSDGAPFWGCSGFPKCRGTRELAAGSDGGSHRAKRDPSAGGRFDRLVLACGAVGLVTGLGFIIVGLNSGPTTYSLVGVVLVGLVALVVLLSPFLPREFARGSALKIALFCVFVAVFIVVLGPFSNWFAQYWTGVIMHSIPTPSAASPSIAH